jgi:hypothetical protein
MTTATQADVLYTCPTCGHACIFFLLKAGAIACTQCDRPIWPDRDTVPARIERADVGFEDHGIFTLDAGFDYGSTAQGLGYFVDQDFIERFIRACGAQWLRECIGRIVYVTHDWGKVYRIDPMPFDSKRRPKPFDIEAWAADLEAKRREVRA